MFLVLDPVPEVRLTILVNPAGGAGKAQKVWNSVSEMFSVAQIKTNVIGKLLFFFKKKILPSFKTVFSKTSSFLKKKPFFF